MAEREIEVTYRTSTSFTFKVTGLDTSYTANDRQYVVYIDDVQDSGRLDLAGGVSETPAYTKSGLSPNTTYKITVNISYMGGYVSVEHTTKTLASSVQIEPWDWSANTNRIKAYQALVNHTSLSNFSHKVWNELCDKTRETAIWWDSDPYDSTNEYNLNLKMNVSVTTGAGKTYTTDKYITKARYNRIINLLSTPAYYCGISLNADKVAVGDIITSVHFLNFATDLNRVIARTNA